MPKSVQFNPEPPARGPILALVNALQPPIPKANHLAPKLLSCDISRRVERWQSGLTRTPGKCNWGFWPIFAAFANHCKTVVNKGLYSLFAFAAADHCLL
jgi:hypothetical protein